MRLVGVPLEGLLTMSSHSFSSSESWAGVYLKARVTTELGRAG